MKIMNVQHILYIQTLCYTTILLISVKARNFQYSYDPRLRHIAEQNYYANTAPNITNHQEQQQIYYLPQQNFAPAEIAKYRQQGNYYHGTTGVAASAVPAGSAQFYQHFMPAQQAMNAERRENILAIQQVPAPVANFESRIYHLPHNNDSLYAPLYQRRYTDIDSKVEKRAATNAKKSIARNKKLDDIAAQTLQQPPLAASLEPAKEIRSFHDIFMRYAGPQTIAFGHVEQRPDHFEQRFEKQHKGQRYKGEIIWADDKGTYGMQQWNLAQGKL